ncbi:MAG: ribonuclease J [Candidatus Levybacteria bacterium]|nr:ribonuclease J [Candidatus Levybacteria bacterium]
MNEQLSFIPLGGIGDVTKNMYLYEYGSEILIVDCGIGFADETMLGVDLLLPDISYLINATSVKGQSALRSEASGSKTSGRKKKILGMLLTHGHEDHIGALPYILPQLLPAGKQVFPFPIYATPLTAALANEKLKEYSVNFRVKTVSFAQPTVHIGKFTATFIRITHSVPDTSHIFIQTPIGNFYHGSDFKIDETPFDKKPSDIEKIKQVAKQGVLCLLSDCLGSERRGKTPSEMELTHTFRKELQAAKGKVIVTTYSSNISRLNQIIQIAKEYNRHVCFVGRSLLKAKDVAQSLGYMQLPEGLEIPIEDAKLYNDSQLLFFVAGSQAQENSAMSRIANGDLREIRLEQNDLVIFSSDPIPGNETAVYSLIDTISRRGARALYSDMGGMLHVSGHGYADDLIKIMQLLRPKKMLPIGGTYRHMVAYRTLAEEQGYKKSDVLLLDDGQEVLFNPGGAAFGQIIKTDNVYVDEISGEEIEGFVLRDRKKLSEGGIVIILVEVNVSDGQLTRKPDIIVRGVVFDEKRFDKKLEQTIQSVLRGRHGRVTNWIHIRKMIGETAERLIFRMFRRRPLVLPIVIEV